MRVDAKKKLVALGRELLDQLRRRENPYLSIPIRSLSNIIYDERTKLIRLGNKTAKRYFLNVAHAKKFMQTLLVAAKCKELLEEGIHTSLRELFYNLKYTLPGSKENTFDEEHESNAVIEDLEVMLDLLREQLHLNADPKGRVVGRVTIVDAGDTIHLDRLGSGGWHIPSNVEDIKFKRVEADFVLVVEKDAIWERLNEDKFWLKHKCILISTKGQAARGARRFIRRLHEEFSLPVYVFTDSDPYGWYIYSVIKSGSMNLAYISSQLATPEAKFIGLSMTDVIKYELRKWTIKATDYDLKRAKELSQYRWFKHALWQREIKLMLEKGYKAELESLAAKGLRFVSEVYLPEKISNQDFLP